MIGSRTEHFKSLTKNYHSSAIADHINATGRNIKAVFSLGQFWLDKVG